ncbi:hypothetical protein CAPTEDRAFT_216833 [Capitella teleta]|uniref:Uncharacterized protein n=1 Tax=Capitella teleta TaxID=283909 RepID=R7UYY2_CAPTE|nr:hypothetical protein CAPTEDRAFT_216833 [Capitella teleta]|eukprot:ELU09147.1 hypothetical protein CAPTEDRAFT_216833 [Capitella teleta]
METARALLFEKLYRSDVKVHQTCSQITDGIDTFRKIAGRVNLGPDGKDELIRRVAIVGSAREGCICPRMLTAKEVSFEVDLMVSAVTVPAEKTQDLVVLLDGKPGLCKIKTAEVMKILPPKVKEKLTEMTVETNMEQLENEEFISGRTIKRLAEHIFRYKDSDGTLIALSERLIGDGSQYEVKHRVEFHGPSTNLILQLYKNDEVLASGSIDFVMIIQMESLPDAALQWTRRPRQWPGEALIKEAIAHGCQIVAKPAKSDELIDHDIWRFTFTKIENHLLSNRTKEQQLVYLIAKCIHYQHVCVKHGDSEFSSYCLKTSFMWMLEDTPPERWTTENPFVLVGELYKRLEGYLTGKRLDGYNYVPHYFIPSLNLLDEYPDELVAIVGEKVKRISQNILGHLPTEEEVMAVVEKSELVLNFMKEKMPSVIQYFVEKQMKEDSKRDRCEESINKFLRRFRSYEEEDLD